jgi:hypothetical protein
MGKFKIANQYSNAWNNLDIKLIAPYLHNDFVYGSQMVLENINGKANYLDYLKKKFNAIILFDEPVVCEVAEYQNEPCLVLTQQMKNSDSSLPKEKHGILLLKFEGDFLKSAHMCMIAPTINEITRYA